MCGGLLDGVQEFTISAAGLGKPNFLKIGRGYCLIHLQCVIMQVVQVKMLILQLLVSFQCSATLGWFLAIPRVVQVQSYRADHCKCAVLLEWQGSTLSTQYLQTICMAVCLFD